MYTMYLIISYYNEIEIKLEKTEGPIKNGQSRDTGNIGHTRHRTNTKENKHNTT